MALNISECRDGLNALRDLIRTVSATPSPLAMELKLHPKYIETPALRLISDALHEAINKPDGRLILSVPPQEGKTELVRAAIVKALRDQPDLRVILGSYNQGIASHGGAAIKNLIEANPDLGLRIAGDTRAKAEWKIAGHNGGLVARGRGSGVAGRAADLLIIDDPFKEGEAQSETIREEAWTWYREGLATRLSPGASVILIMTRWHSDDLVGRLIEQDAHAGWTVVNIPAQCDDPDTDPLGREYGDFLVSARGRTREQWEQRKLTAGSQTWNALYQGRPSPPEGGLVKRDWWQRYATPLWEEHPDGTCWATGFDELIMSADLTFKGAANADRVAIGVWGRRVARAYLLDLTVGRMEFVPTVAAFAKLAAKWPQATLKLVEDKANGPALMSMLAKRIPGIVPYDPGRIGKVPRLLAVAPLIEAGNVYIPTDSLASWADEYVEEHAGFPNAAHDDLVDMTSQALDRLLVRPLSQLGTTVTDMDDYDDWRIGY